MPGFSKPEPCTAHGCTAGPTEVRAYLPGWRCPLHTPARERGIPEPAGSLTPHAPAPRTSSPPMPDDTDEVVRARSRATHARQRTVDVPHAHPGRTLTSSAAARKVLPKTGTQKREILDALIEAHSTGHVGATDPELERRLGISANSVRPRRGELVGLGLVYDSGRTRDHLGNAHIVWAPSSGSLAACGHRPQE